MSAQVECRSDWEYAQRPVAFTWQDQRLEVYKLITEYRTPAGNHFLVSTIEAGVFELVYNKHSDQWIIQPKPSKESA
jgi:hypothetical protein